MREPVFQAPARWIEPGRDEEAALKGLTVVSPTEVLATHLLEVLKANFARLLTLRGLRRILEEFSSVTDPRRAAANRRLLDELIPDKVQIETLLAVMRLLLDEGVSVRNLPLILEAIAELRTPGAPPETVCDHVRQRLGFQLVAELKRADGTLPLVQLAPVWDDTFMRHQIDGNGAAGMDVALPPADFARLGNGLAETFAGLAEEGTRAALVTTARRRRFLRMVMASRDIQAPALSFEEIGIEARPALVAQVA